MSKEDPKPGRWILPLVIAALIGFTYVFVNALPPATVAQSTTTTTSAAATTTSSTSTTTTLPSETEAFLAAVDDFDQRAKDANSLANDANDAWEDRENTGATFEETLAAFEQVEADTKSLADDMAATEPLEGVESLWEVALTAAGDMVAASEALIEGLRAPDDGTLRREAMDAYNQATGELLRALDAVRANVTS